MQAQKVVLVLLGGHLGIKVMPVLLRFFCSLPGSLCIALISSPYDRFTTEGASPKKGGLHRLVLLGARHQPLSESSSRRFHSWDARSNTLKLSQTDIYLNFYLRLPFLGFQFQYFRVLIFNYSDFFFKISKLPTVN